MPCARLSRYTSATFAARAFARCRAIYRDICLNAGDIRDWRACCAPRIHGAARFRWTCGDICLHSSDIPRLARAAKRAARGSAPSRSTCRDICLDSSDIPRLSRSRRRAARGFAPYLSTFCDMSRHLPRSRSLRCRIVSRYLPEKPQQKTSTFAKKSATTWHRATAYSMGGARLLVFRCRRNKSLSA